MRAMSLFGFPFVKPNRSALLAAVVASLAFAFATPAAYGQDIPPEVLEQLRQRAEGAAGQAQRSPVDAARARTPGPNGMESGLGQAAAEQALRQEAAREELNARKLPSRLEVSYRQRTREVDLLQFGYDIFRDASGAALLNPVGRVGPDYILGIGDEVIATFQGAESRTVTTRVDSEGRLLVGDLPPIAAAGRTLGSVEAEIVRSTKSTMLGTDVFVSVGGVRAITVVVGGEVFRPGAYQFTSLSDVVFALAEAGGVRKSGSLRNIYVERGARRILVDVYGLLGIGQTANVRLRDGDRIIVPVIGETIAVVGGVSRPGIYEIRRGESASTSDVIEWAGGAIMSRGSTISVARFDGKGQEVPLSAATPLRVQAGDIVQATAAVRGESGFVQLSGHVYGGGRRAISEAPTLASLLVSLQNLRSNTYLPFSILLRRDPVTTYTYLEAVSLYDVFQRGRDIPLRRDDAVYLLSDRDVAFLRSETVRLAIYGELGPDNSCTSLQRLSALVSDTQSGRFNALTRGALVIRSNGQARIAQAVGVQAELGRRTAEEVVDDIVTNDDGNCPAIFEDQPDFLPFLVEHAVGVTGSVRRPGVYPVASAIPADILSRFAGGLVNSEQSVNFELMSTADASGRIARDMRTISPPELAAVSVNPGDVLRFTDAGSGLEPGAVLLSGEVRNPGIYTIRRGEKLSELIERAGGITEYAYPYGAVLTRVRVKEAQEEGFRRTARELNTALLSLSARKNMSGEAVIAASQLAQTFATVTAPGRVVVEADPRVLRAKPELDTVVEAGDTLFMPKKPNFVLTLGDVLNPGAFQFEPAKSVHDYLSETGGLQSTADDDSIYLVYPNGIAAQVRKSNWRRSSQILPPGTTIVVPKNIDPLYTLDLARDISTIIGQFATAVASIAILSR